MLRRRNTKSSNRLSRRQSASSIYTKQDHISPETARLQAQAAATYAFARAYERDYAEMGNRGEVSRRKQVQDQQSIPDNDKETGQRGRSLRRQQSVRFTGPEAAPKSRTAHPQTFRVSSQDKGVTSTLRPRALTNNVPVPAAYRPPSRSSSIGKASIGNGTAQRIVTALAAYDEYYTREDDVLSTPSSYRRMRKSQSTRTLCSPSKAANNSLKDIMTSSDYNTRTWNHVPWIQSQQLETILKAPKSMSFLRGGRDYMKPALRDNNDDAVQMARDKFLHQIEQQRLREQPSFLFRAKARREEKSFRQSVRSGSGNSFGLAVGSANQSGKAKESSLRSSMRKASQTIKKRWRELLKLDKDQLNQTIIPAQQVSARKSHDNASYISGQKAREDEACDIFPQQSAANSRLAMQLPALHSLPSYQELRSRNGSIRSQRSESSEKSRVTSWTTAAENTMTSRHTQAEREAQRLSIIQENGMHISTTSSAHLGVSSQLSAYPIFHRPHNAQKRGGQRTGTVDSQKVYSALVRRLDENSPVAKLEAQRVLSSERFGPAVGIPPRSTSVNSGHSSRERQTPATIRHVKNNTFDQNGDKEMRSKTMTSLPHEDDDVFSPKPPLQTNTPLKLQDAPGDPGFRKELQIPPQQQAARNERLAKPPIILRETRSTFFGNSSFTVNRSTSPYRRVLAATDYRPAAMAGEVSVTNNSNRIFFTPPLVHCSDPKDPSDEAYTESIYSRTTSGKVPATGSSQSLSSKIDDYRLNRDDSVNPGCLITYQPSGPTRNRNSSFGSFDGRELLSPEVTVVEKSKETSRVPRVNHALPSMPKYSGHYREQTQIMDDNADIYGPMICQEKQPVGIFQEAPSQRLQPKPILKHKASTSLDGFPLPPPPPPPLPPLVPMRSPLRPMQPRTTARSLDASSNHRPPSAQSSAIKHVPVDVHQLGSGTNSNHADTSPKFIKLNGQRSKDSGHSPGIGAAVERQFGSVGSRTPYSGTENYSPADTTRGGKYEASVISHKEIRDTEAQAMGSRVMVDMFLSSRRRKVAGSDESNAFL